MVATLVFWAGVGLAGFMLAVHLVILAGILRASIREHLSASGVEQAANRNGPAVSVSLVVPCKDEEDNLPRLLESLKPAIRRSLERRKIELILIDDRSRDNTAEIMESFRDACEAGVQGLHVQVLHVEQADSPLQSANPKQYALSKGTASATGDILLFTDADCTVGASWIEDIASLFDMDEQLGLVFGPLVARDRSTFLTQYQAFDQLFRYFYTAGAAGLGVASGGYGNNLACRASVLAEVGGYEGIGISVTEDAQLISAVRKTERYRIYGLTRKRVSVSPRPQQGIGAMLRQSLRWNAGGLKSPDLPTRMSYGLVMLYLSFSVYLVPVVLVAAALGLSTLWPVLFTTLSSFLSMLAVAVAAGVATRRPLAYWGLLVPNVVFSMLFYSVVTFRTLIGARVEWKGAVLPG